LDFELDLKFKFAQIDPHYQSFTRTCFTNFCRLQKPLTLMPRHFPLYGARMFAFNLSQAIYVSTRYSRFLTLAIIYGLFNQCKINFTTAYVN